MSTSLFIKLHVQAQNKCSALLRLWSFASTSLGKYLLLHDLHVLQLHLRFAERHAHDGGNQWDATLLAADKDGHIICCPDL